MAPPHSRHRSRLSPLMFHLLQDLRRGTTHAVPTALAVVVRGDRSTLWPRIDSGRRRPLGVEFRPRPRQVFRFVFSVGLQPRDVLHALEEVPTTFQPAVERCRRKEDILESFARDYVEPTADERKRPGPSSKLRRPSDSGFWADIGRYFDNRRGPLTVGNQLVRRSWMPAVQKYCFCDGSSQP